MNLDADDDAEDQPLRRHAVDFCRRRTHEGTWLPLAISGLVAGLSTAAAYVPHFAVGFISFVIGAALLWIAARTCRTIRRRIEDREDAAYAAAWRAAHRAQQSPVGARR